MIHWNDWKPLTGENVWAAMLGPLQALFLENCSNIQPFSNFENAPPEVQLAVSIMPAVLALQSPLGSLYHCPLGTKVTPPDPDEATIISNENNFSAWAAFKAFLFILQNFYTNGDPVLDFTENSLKTLIAGLETWFQKSLIPLRINQQYLINAGGHVTFAGVYQPTMPGEPGAFSVETQIEALLVLGAKKFDSYYTQTTAFDVWQITKQLGGFYVNSQLAGVGFSQNQGANVWSGRLSLNAIIMCRRLSMDYAAMGNQPRAQSLLADATSMMKWTNSSVAPGKDGVWNSGGLLQVDGSYLNTNKRSFLPWWGYYANPVGATGATSWGVFIQFSYNPFELGGTFTNAPGNFWSTQCKDNPPIPGILAKLASFYAQ